MLFRVHKVGEWHVWRDHSLQVLATLMHANHLEREYGAGPHTISVPRMRPADGSDVSSRPTAWLGRFVFSAHG